jgi:hypothetical protein
VPAGVTSLKTISRGAVGAGETVGVALGVAVGIAVGNDETVGPEVGVAVGVVVGTGDTVGNSVGLRVGVNVGENVTEGAGEYDGADVGASSTAAMTAFWSTAAVCASTRPFKLEPR